MNEGPGGPLSTGADSPRPWNRLLGASPLVIRALLLGGRGAGGEEVFVRGLAEEPPEGVAYTLALDPHESVPGARALALREILLNRLVHPFLWPLPGFKAYAVSKDTNLVHVHNFVTWLRVPRACPVVYSLGGATYPHYLQTYLSWSRDRVTALYRRARLVYRPLGMRNEIVAPDRIDAIIVFSEFAARQLKPFGVPKEKIHVIPPGFRIPRAPPSRRSEGLFTFLLVGRDPERKGADLAVAAARSLHEDKLAVRLRLVGDGAYVTMTDGVVVDGVGPVDRHRLFREFYGSADAVLVPSRAEGFGFVAAEAIGHGLPVIASRRDALPEIIKEAGLLVDPGSVHDLRDAMASLVRDRNLVKRLGAMARRRFEAEFSLERSRQRLRDLYDRLLAGAS